MKKQNKSLGKGINALFQDLSDIEEVEATEKIVELSLNELLVEPLPTTKNI